MAAPAATTLLPGFAEPSLDSQRVFRATLEAMARPGTIMRVPATIEPPTPLDRVTAALLLALADQDTPLWLDHAACNAETEAWLRFHCGCPIVSAPELANFAVIADPAAMPPLAAFPCGSDEYPDRSATVIIQVPSLTAGGAWILKGPGIRHRAELTVAGLAPDFKDQAGANHALFPRGVDLVFASGDQIVALPRSTRLGDD
jgi:alpha-D-ribose 1-methylphosphonate 5-triphosphate synthase subunit PhnH